MGLLGILSSDHSLREDLFHSSTTSIKKLLSDVTLIKIKLDITLKKKKKKPKTTIHMIFSNLFQVMFT